MNDRLWDEADDFIEIVSEDSKDMKRISEPQGNKEAEKYYEPKVEQYQGKSHIVVPVVLMAEGVHNGSHGPVLHSEEDLAKYPASWNGIPVVVQHPEEDGINVSANSPAIIEQAKVGRIFNTHFDSGKLRAEAWLDEERLSNISPESLACIKQGLPLEVSVGVFTDDEESVGTWNGEDYTAISHNHRPDHLALLPSSKGACSWEDGCGIRANEEGGGSMRVLTDQAGHKIQCYEDKPDVDLLKLSENIRRLLDGPREVAVPSNSLGYCYLEELHEDYIVFFRDDGTEKHFKQSYKIGEDGAPELVGEPVQVEKKTVFNKVKEGGLKSMGDNKGNSCCPEKVELLIQSEAMNFGEDQREWLEGLEEEQIDELLEANQTMEEKDEEIAMLKEEIVNLKKALNKKPKEKVVVNEVVKEVTPQMNEEQAIKVLEDHLSDPEKFMDLLPDSTKRQMQHGLRLHQAYRTDLITKIKDNAPAGIYTDEELTAMEDYDLERMSKLVQPKVDYSPMGRQGGPSDYSATIEPLLPPGVMAAA